MLLLEQLAGVYFDAEQPLESSTGGSGVRRRDDSQ